MNDTPRGPPKPAHPPDGSSTTTSLTFVTGNAGKVRELQGLLGPTWLVRQDPRGYPEIQAATLEEVVRDGARHLLMAGLEPPFVLEDSGLFIDALGGFPGVYSRYALDTIGCAGIVRLMEGARGRSAHFQACIGYVDPEGGLHAFTGRCEGTIAEAPRGDGGFGFDPLFVPQGGARTFAEDPAAKAPVSHRAKAVAGLLECLKESANP